MHETRGAAAYRGTVALVSAPLARRQAAQGRGSKKAYAPALRQAAQGRAPQHCAESEAPRLPECQRCSHGRGHEVRTLPGPAAGRWRQPALRPCVLQDYLSRYWADAPCAQC